MRGISWLAENRFASWSKYGNMQNFLILEQLVVLIVTSELYKVKDFGIDVGRI